MVYISIINPQRRLTNLCLAECGISSFRRQVEETVSLKHRSRRLSEAAVFAYLIDFIRECLMYTISANERTIA